MEKIPQEKVLEAYRNAPPFVREVFNAEETTQVILNLKTQYQLHIDQAGEVGKGVGYLLLGLVDPAGLSQILQTNGIPPNAVQTVMKEINEKIFIPLRDRLRKAPSSTQGNSSLPASPEQVPTSVKNPPPPTLQRPVTPVPAYVPPPAPKPIAAAPSAPGTFVPPAPATISSQAPLPQPPVGQATQPTRPASPMSRPIPSGPAPRPPMPPTFGTAPAEPRTMQTVRMERPVPAPPPNLPGVILPPSNFVPSAAPVAEHGVPIPASAPVPPIVPPPAPSLEVKASPPPAAPRKSGVDPYREPIE